MSSTVSPWKNFKTINAQDFNGIDEISTDFDENAPCEIYNLNGVKMIDSFDSLAPGLYLIRQGKNVKKQIVK